MRVLVRVGSRNIPEMVQAWQQRAGNPASASYHSKTSGLPNSSTSILQWGVAG
jgi:hypothetical protein